MIKLIEDGAKADGYGEVNGESEPIISDVSRHINHGSYGENSAMVPKSRLASFLQSNSLLLFFLNLVIMGLRIKMV